MINQIHNMDALELLSAIEPQSVDAIITDLPYGTTACSWDEIIPFEPMWAGVKRVLKPRGVFVTTASQPFTSALVMSNPKWFKYEWVWDKVRVTGHLDAKRKPLKQHENILVFSDGQPLYIPQMVEGALHIRGPWGSRNGKSSVYGDFVDDFTRQNESNLYYPTSIYKLRAEMKSIHPTQKPLELYKYLINTYTQPNDLVVDFCCGSGTTAVAAATLNRRFIAGDTSAEYCAIARRRLETITPDMFETLLPSAPDNR